MSDDTCWYPATHRYQGGCTDARLVLPHYDTMPGFIRVYDTAVRNSGWQRWQKKEWRRIRAKALTLWGVPAVFKERGLEDLDYKPHGITLRVQYDDGQSSNNYGGFGLYPLEPGWQGDYNAVAWAAEKGYVMMHPKTVRNAFLGRNYGYLTGAMTHEFGHAFGFGHGGNGIMRSAVEPPYAPSTEEKAALQSYWGL